MMILTFSRFNSKAFVIVVDILIIVVAVDDSYLLSAQSSEKVKHPGMRWPRDCSANDLGQVNLYVCVCVCVREREI